MTLWPCYSLLQSQKLKIVFSKFEFVSGIPMLIMFSYEILLISKLALIPKTNFRLRLLLVKKIFIFIYGLQTIGALGISYHYLLCMTSWIRIKRKIIRKPLLEDFINETSNNTLQSSLRGARVLLISSILISSFSLLLSKFETQRPERTRLLKGHLAEGPFKLSS